MSIGLSKRNRTGFLRHNRSGAVSIIFATSVVPLTLCVGLAVDYGFYVQALAQTTMAADAAAIHAVRIAVTSFNAGATAASAGTTGGKAGLQWFQAQLGTLSTGSAPISKVTVAPANAAANCAQSPCVGYDQSTGTFSTQVSYTVNVPTHFGGLVNIPLWTSNLVASAAVTANAFVEVDMILDTSASMSIGTTPQDMLKIEQLSVCMPTAIATNYLSTGAQADVFQYTYSPVLGTAVGYAPASKTSPDNTPTFLTNMLPNSGKCNPAYDGSSALCQPTASLIPPGPLPPGVAANVNLNGYCPPGYGAPDVSTPTPKTDSLNKLAVANLPVPTCSLSCHDNPSSTAANPSDLFGLVGAANNAGANISIRLDVVTQAAASVIGDLIAKEAQLGLPNQFSVGVYEINSSYGQQDYPVPGGAFVEAGTNLQAAQTITANIQPTNNSTDIDDPLKAFASLATPSGSGGTAATPRKNIFIVTDGLQDSLRAGLPAGPRWSTVTPANCTTLKTMGFNIFVLYTPYYPLPHYQYLQSIKQLAEPLNNSAITAALSACASQPNQFFQAASQADINTAMTTMLNLALNQPATITH